MIRIDCGGTVCEGQEVECHATLGDDDEAMRHRISSWSGYFASVSLFLISTTFIYWFVLMVKRVRIPQEESK